MKDHNQSLAEMDEVFAVFLPYIQSTPTLDILYSEKFGYLLISPESGVAVMHIQTAEQMLHVLFEAIIRETIHFSDRHLYIAQSLLPVEKEACRLSAASYINRISDSERKAEYQKQLDAHLDGFPHCYCINGKVHIMRLTEE